MSNYIVLVKQVPDVTQISDNAFNPVTGTLMRNKLASVINELDTQALALAHHMRQLANDRDGKLICLTMGPPMAAEVLQYCLARGADIGVLLTDRLLGGADTWATANPLAFAVRKIVKDILGGNDDYFIISGMQSVDGDTAQVPAQMAAELKLPCISYATGVEYKQNEFQFARIISGGSQIVASKSKPCIITVAKYEYPLFATFAASRKAKHATFIQWGVDDVKPTTFGVAGSKTQVVRVFPPGKTNRKCVHLTNIEDLGKAVINSLTVQEHIQTSASATAPEYVLPAKRKSVFDRRFEGTAKEIEDAKLVASMLCTDGITDVSQINEQAAAKLAADLDGKLTKKAIDEILAGFKAVEPTYKGDVWVMAEHDEDGPNTATFELIGKARHLADSLEAKVGVVLAGSKIESMSAALIAAGADNIYLVDHPVLSQFDPVTYCKAVSPVIDKYAPQIMLFGATPQGRVLAPMVSYHLGCGLTADCTSLDIRDNSRKGEIAVLMQTRPALGGNVMATICTKDSRCQMATARPGVMKRLEPDLSRKGTVIKHAVDLSDADVSLKIVSTEMGHGSVNLGHAKAIVSGGKGMRSRDNYEQLLSMFSSAISSKTGIEVEIGASRAAVEQGFTQRIRQVGQTGTSVGPKLYVAMGISGAIQHMIGVANSETIIAVNADPHAPIFKLCDYYYVGNVEDIIPKLVESIKGL